MSDLFITMIGPKGDDLGHLPLSEIAIGLLGESSGKPVAPELAGEMTELCASIRTALLAEGLEPSLDDIDLRIAISKALMSPGEDGPEIPVPVHEAGVGRGDKNASGTEQVDGGANELPVADWDALLSVNEEGGGTHV